MQTGETTVNLADLFDQFVEASTLKGVLSIHHRILELADLTPCEFGRFFPKFKRAIIGTKARKNWKAKALFSKIDKKSTHRCYSNTKAVPAPVDERDATNNDDDTDNNNLPFSSLSPTSNGRPQYSHNALRGHSCLVIGSGPAGLRTAIELQLLGSKRVVVVEKRSRFSRNNVLHLWPFLIDDLKSLGAKKFYGKFCAGSIDHISIRQLQLMLTKICLMIGCDFRESCSYLSLCPASVAQEQSQEASEPISGDTSSEPSDSIRCDSSNNVAFKCPLDEAEQLNANQSSGLFTKVQQDEASTDKSVDKACQDKLGEPARGTRAHFQSDFKMQEKELHSYSWDIIIGADGRRNTLRRYFPRKEFRGRLAIAITANFINRQTPAETAVPEISGLSFIFNQDMFNALAEDTRIELENICYYKDDTHYFVMTAKKRSLLERGVLTKDCAQTQDLLAEANVDRAALLKYARDAAFWTTGLEPLDFALNHYGQEDCAMFDFTSMYAASNACKAIRTRNGHLVLLGLVGDSLLEPFWPTGSGCARGFLSSFDAAWMCRQWAVHRCATPDSANSWPWQQQQARSMPVSKRPEYTIGNRFALSVMAERESIYRILAQTTSENLQQNYSRWTLNPHTRYPNLNRHLVVPSRLEHLISGADGKFSLPPEVHVAPRKRLAVPLTLGGAGRARRVKSPLAQASRRSPKKLECSSNPQSSPTSRRQVVASNGQYKRAATRSTLSAYSEADLELEQSYSGLDDGYYTNTYATTTSQELDGLESYYMPSISGTAPSSSNLLSLEKRRAREIDDCLRQRRQRTQLTAVRERLLEQFQASSNGLDDKPTTGEARSLSRPSKLLMGSNIFSDFRLQLRGKENNSSENPLRLLNSIRRCASFAERVKSFETKMGSPLPSDRDQSATLTPRIQVDNVRNLPQFATLQQLLVSETRRQASEPAVRKLNKMPVMKLTKDDWNVKCWEDRLTAEKDPSARPRSSNQSKSCFHKTVSLDSYRKPKKQVDVFRDRIREMADKLDKSTSAAAGGEPIDESSQSEHETLARTRTQGDKTWISRIQRELTQGNEKQRKTASHGVPIKPIKKLFENDGEDEGDDGIDVDKHYDHLCVRRPTNKYLSRNGGYSSHLTRVKYNDSSLLAGNTARSAQIETTASRPAYQCSRGSSASSTISSEPPESSPSNSSVIGDGQQPPTSSDCARCRTTLGADKISIGGRALHRACLTCFTCSRSLRTNEILYHLSGQSVSDNEQQANDFYCSVCRSENEDERQVSSSQTGAPYGSLSSRQNFLQEHINYNEIYRNIVDDSLRAGGGYEAMSTINRLASNRNLDARRHGETSRADAETGASSTNDEIGSQSSLTRPMVDEEELERILHLDKRSKIANTDDLDEPQTTSIGSSSSSGQRDRSSKSASGGKQEVDESSSLGSSGEDDFDYEQTEAYEDEDDEDDNHDELDHDDEQEDNSEDDRHQDDADADADKEAKSPIFDGQSMDTRVARGEATKPEVDV